MIGIAAVTVLEDRAAITRRDKVAVVAGQQRIVIERVAPVLVDKTLTATAAGARVGSNAPKPLPNALRGFSCGVVTIQNLLG